MRRIMTSPIAINYDYGLVTLIRVANVIGWETSADKNVVTVL
jgi:hypothetical protein